MRCAAHPGGTVAAGVWDYAEGLPNIVEASYWRGDTLEKRRRLMEEWAAFHEARPAAKEAVCFYRQIAP